MHQKRYNSSLFNFLFQSSNSAEEIENIKDNMAILKEKPRYSK